MLMSFLLAVVKYVTYVDTRSKTGTGGGLGGLGGKWAIDKRHGTGVEQNSLLHLESHRPKSFFLPHKSTNYLCTKCIVNTEYFIQVKHKP
jgi:hypothetical protein